MKYFIPIFLCFFATTSLLAQDQLPLKKKDLATLKSYMVGTFTSEVQSKADTTYFNIHLNMKQMWKEKKDGYWLYVEQAAASALEKPYRQRVYHLFLQDDKTIVSQVYELEKPLRFVGEWKKKTPLAQLTADSLKSREGCAIYLHKNIKGEFYGSTPGKECLSSLRGATYATSEVTISKELIFSWDRGFDVVNRQVWGATKGGYRFIRKK
jgi:hypothetical protein